MATMVFNLSKKIINLNSRRLAIEYRHLSEIPHRVVEFCQSHASDWSDKAPPRSCRSHAPDTAIDPAGAAVRELLTGVLILGTTARGLRVARCLHPAAGPPPLLLLESL
ncbi:hypothetical protein Syun_007466 [Stephania yunnanensis]|uniref:Uncharacterized protein n=1 Tax=Stephania yunnanensis TaxID=152371 RepID=A0AAP0PZD5_9MAGN